MLRVVKLNISGLSAGDGLHSDHGQAGIGLCDRLLKCLLCNRSEFSSKDLNNGTLARVFASLDNIS